MMTVTAAGDHQIQGLHRIRLKGIIFTSILI
jgi:hypothetical protein